MNGMENIAELLQSMLSGNEFGKTEDKYENNPDSEADASGEECRGNDTDDFFGGIDIEMLLKLGSLFAEMQKPNRNAELLHALKPMMRDENKEKIDTAIKLMRIMALLPLLRENGLMDKIF